MTRSISAVSIVVVLLVAGCSGQLGAGDPPDQGAGRVMECTAPYAFAGRSSLAALGLADLGGPDVNRVGMVWITRDPAPVVCIEWPDGSGMATILSEPFLPPGAEPGDAPPQGLVALGAIALILAVATIVSYVAYRRERPSAD